MRAYSECEFKNKLEVGEMVLAKIVLLDDKIIMLEVNGHNAIMSLSDYDIFNEETNQKSVRSNKGRNILARVKYVRNDLIILERKSIVMETIEILKKRIGDVVPATIEHRMDYGLFVDLGNGVTSLVHANEVSYCRHQFHVAFSVGEMIKVKLMKYDPKNNFFICSRKQAYPKIEFKRGEKCIVTFNAILPDKTGFFVEYDPGNAGIMDIPENKANILIYGKKAQVMIKNVGKKGFKCDFCKMIY